MRIPRLLMAALIVSGTLGCYRATVETGLIPSEQVVRKESASAWLGGLVGPQKIDARTKCPSGVAQVQTRQSLRNQIVGYVTLGIYTPMTIEVTCAKAPADSPANASGTTRD